MGQGRLEKPSRAPAWPMSFTRNDASAYKEGVPEKKMAGRSIPLGIQKKKPRFFFSGHLTNSRFPLNSLGAQKKIPLGGDFFWTPKEIE